MNTGSKLAGQIISDLKREEAFKKYAQRNKCMLDNKKQCDICKYTEICDNSK